MPSGKEFSERNDKSEVLITESCVQKVKATVRQGDEEKAAPYGPGKGCLPPRQANRKETFKLPRIVLALQGGRKEPDAKGT